MHYQPFAGGQNFIRLMFVGFAAFAALLIGTSVKGDGPPLVFTVFWLFALAWNAYWWLFRVANDIDLEGDSLTWSAALRTRSVPLTDLIQVRPARFSSSAMVIEVSGQRPILTLASNGVQAFASELRRRRPDLPVSVGKRAR
jgi:hypothetical protein